MPDASTPDDCHVCDGTGIVAVSAATKPETIGDAPIEPEFHDLMNKMAVALDNIFNGEARGADRQTGFVLLVFPFEGREGRANYISNADRADIVTLLKEQLARFEGQPELSGRA